MNFYLLLAIVFLVVLISLKELNAEIRYAKAYERNSTLNPTRPLNDITVVLVMVFIAVFAWFCAVRDLNTNDAVPYKEYFEALDVQNFFEVQGQYNLFFEFFAKLCKIIVENNYKAFFAAVALFNCLLVYGLLIKTRDINPNLAFLAYIVMFGFYYNYIVLRQGMALTMFLYALYYIKKNKLVSVIFIIMACLFHEAAVFGILIFVPLFINKNKSNSYYYCIIAIVVLLYFVKITDRLMIYCANLILHSNILPARFNKYILYVTDIEFTYDISLMHLINFVLIAFMVNRRPANDDVYEYLLDVTLIGQAFLGMFSNIVPVVRIVDFYMLACVILFAKMNYKMKGTGKVLVYEAYVLVLLVFYVRMIYYLAGFTGI